MSPQRSTREVLNDPLRLTQKWDLETDLERNFSEDAFLLTGQGVFLRVRWRAGGVPPPRRADARQWTYHIVIAVGKVGSPEWTAQHCWPDMRELR